jgi:hypothetical protein
MEWIVSAKRDAIELSPFGEHHQSLPNGRSRELAVLVIAGLADVALVNLTGDGTHRCTALDYKIGENLQASPWNRKFNKRFVTDVNSDLYTFLFRDPAIHFSASRTPPQLLIEQLALDGTRDDSRISELNDHISLTLFVNGLKDCI